MWAYPDKNRNIHVSLYIKTLLHLQSIKCMEYVEENEVSGGCINMNTQYS